MKTKKRMSLAEIAFQTINYIIFIAFALICMYPFYYVFLNSISDPMQVLKNPIILLPRGFTLNNYISIFKLEGIGNAFFISVSRAMIGTCVTLFFSSMFAYILTKKETPARKIIYRMVVVVMYINAGIIPWFLTMKTMHLDNNFLLYILPMAISPYNLILIKTYMEGIDPGIEESAIIDGAGYFTLFTKIIIQLSKPILAACAVFSAVSQWNSWQDNFFLVNNKNLQTLQLILLNYLRQAENIVTMMQQDMTNATNVLGRQKMNFSPFAIRTTITMVVAIPIICIYPLMQKYFVKGIMIGAIKG